MGGTSGVLPSRTFVLGKVLSPEVDSGCRRLRFLFRARYAQLFARGVYLTLSFAL